ncbi:MAG: T9SS type A sorting domain-containing protein [Flavipsychrobacter sp.]|nr:T9SS type A sorting domain-containing protein [Flavipsychrobacter sp.]
MLKLKQVLSLIALCLAATNANAALSGTYTINPSGTASATVYLSLTSAISDMVSAIRTDGGPANGAGVSGPVILELASGYTSGGETFPLTFDAITGASATNTITVRPASGVGSALSITSSNTTATININGGNYFVIDGRPGGTGSNKYITLDNTSTSAPAVQYINDASNNTIKYCTLSGVNTTTFTGAVVLFSTTSGSTGNDNNTIDNCDIRDGATKPLNAIVSAGTVAKENSGITISNCNIYNFFNAATASNGIYVANNSESWTITGNSFYQTGSLTATASSTHRVLVIAGGSGHTITNNYIGGSAALCGGSPWAITGSFASRFVGIDLSVGTTSATSVQGNTIANFNWSTTSGTTTLNGIFCAINIAAGSANVGTTSGNTIGNSSTGSISVTSSTTGGSVNIINCSAASPAVVAISNNTIGSVTSNGSSTSVSCSINGILLSNTGTITISGNTIGNTGTSNSINAVTSSSSATAQAVTGISSSATGTLTITNNTIANLNNNYAGTASAGQVRGIVSSSGVNTITGNTVHNLSTTSANTGTSANATVIGISFTSTSTSGAQIVSQNTVHSLSNTAASAAVSATGIYATGPSGSNLTVSRNNIHSISIASSSTSSVLTGMQIGGGTGNTFMNNMIRVGIDAAGSALTTGYNVYGIYQNLGTSINVYNNSVYVGGTGVSSAQNTYAFYRTQTSAAADVRNNIFVNARSNGSGSAVNAAIFLNSASDYTSSYLTLNNNIYYSPGTGGVLGRVSTTSYATLAEWQQTTGFDILSGAGDPNFVNATGNASVVDLHVSSTTPAEGTGASITSVTDDYDGSTRSGLTPNDIGADAGNFTTSDVFPPRFSFTPFTANTGSVSNRTLSVTINDLGTGVPTSGSLRPRMWFRRTLPSASSWASTTATFNSGSGTSGSWTFTLDYSQLSITPTTGETYEYYLVAQDQATSANLAYSPVTGTAHTDVNTQTSAPTTPNSYTITTALPTSINVGTAQTYTSLTGAGGLFAAINSAALAGNTTVSITSDLSEDGTNALTGAGINGYTLTIQPSAASTRVISNSSDLATSMIRLSGAAGVNIDGRSGGSGQYLRIVNTHATAGSCQPALDILSGSTSTTIRNCIIETNATTSTRGSIIINTGTNTGITINNNDIRDAQGTPGTTGIPANGIYSGSTSNVVSVQNNNVYNFSSNGIHLVSAGDGCTVSGNSVYYNASTTPSTAQVGIYIGSGNNHTISDNYVGGQAASCGGSAWTNSGNITFTCIQLLLGTTTASSVQNNTVQNISLTGTGGVNFNGILVSSGAANIGTISGNLIGHASTTNSIQSTGSTSSGTSVTIGIGTASSSTTTISNNMVANITSSSSSSTTSVGVRGISNTGSGQCTISGNTIYSISANAATTGAQAAPVGILTNSANTSQLITQNTIYNLSNTNTTVVAPSLHGICANQSSSAGTISRNRVYGLSNQATNVPTVNGIFLNSGSAWTVANNQISVSNGSNTNDLVISGIRDGSIGTHNVYYNSVYVGGTASSGIQKSYGYLRTSSATVTVKNNLLYNERSGSTGGQFAIGNTNGTPATGWSSTASNNNLFVVGTLSDMGEWGTGTPQTLAQWQSSSSGDAASYVNDVTTLPSASFYTATATGNLTVQSAFNGQIEGRATHIASVTTDYANTTRDGLSPSIGSIEVPGITWTGATNSTWGTGSNWQGGSAPTTSQTAIIPASLSNYPIITTGTVAVGGITIASGGSVTVSGGTLQVARNIGNSGTFNATGGTIELNGASAQNIVAGTITVTNLILNNSTGATITSGMVNVLDTYTPTSGTLTTGGFLTLKSTASATARIAAGSTSGGYITGSVNTERYIPGGRRAFRFLGHPFTSAQNMSVLTDDIDITGSGGSPFTTTGSNNPSAFSFDVTTGDNSTTGNNPGWTAYTASSTWAQYQAMRVLVRGAKGEGLTSAAYTPSAVTIDMNGTMNQGNQTINLTKGSSTNFVLVGNPFQSQVNMDAVSGTNIGSSFYIWDANQGTRGAYTAYSFGSSSFNLPSGGAFVTTLSANGSVLIEEADKTNGTPGAMLKATGITNQVEMQLKDSTIFWDRLLLNFDDNAMATVDYPDAAKLYNPDMTFYTLSKDDSMLSIDARPYLANETIKLGLYAGIKKNFRFTAPNVNMPAGTKLYFTDKLLNVTQEVTQGFEYWFVVDTSSTSWGNNRFELNTQGVPTNSIANVSTSKLKVKLVPNPTTDNVTLYYEGAGKQLNIVVTNMMGVKVTTAKAENTNGSVLIPTAQLTNGIYNVTIYNGSEMMTQKLIKQ